MPSLATGRPLPVLGITGMQLVCFLLFWSATKAARKAFYEIYVAFVSAFREASERLKRGDRNAPFPTGSFPPALPFVAG